ncbi:cornichon [Nadsonia fulvescens var. elongata DSM 6958]|uniref:Cornichon n=1 Tax=Nadsonia fulvescens var. elongata DSM 6958 TaxID=857566 RepID=A0A1E3PKH0_9ASCO|nr:cornichon [Nadsonia fulvescens var. elongata DSM 6958]
MNGPACIFAFSLVISAIEIFTQIFFTIMFSDLESDYINPIDLCYRLNNYVLPEVAIHTFLGTVFLLNGYFFSLLINMPILTFSINKVYTNNYLLDATDIFKTVRNHKKESFVKLGFFLVFFFFSLYRMIMALVDADNI